MLTMFTVYRYTLYFACCVGTTVCIVSS